MADPPNTQIKRKGFNWQFIGIDPGEDKKDDLSTWTVDQVYQWLKDKNDLSLEALAQKFKNQDIDGSVMKDLTEAELQGELECTLGVKKKFIKERDELIKSQANKNQAADGVVLPKGFMPQAPVLNRTEKEKVKFNRYNAGTRTWVAREVPLTDEEMECWEYQAQWLICAVTQERWFQNPNAILGVGLYHAPRFLSDAEMQRAINDELTATQEKQQKRDEKTQKDSNTVETVRWAKNFQVYPAVVPPPAEYITGLTVDVAEVPLGPMQVIIGPTFNINAYNNGALGDKKSGVRSQKERGVLSMDQQYNAFNFVYYVLRSKGSYERKICTSRLSFFIEEFHGSSVFPDNIESQLSLFIYRDNRLTKGTCKDPEPTRQRLLANAIKKMIPHVLKAVIMEVVNGRATAVDEIIEYSIRTYLLVHQVSIKLILYYRTAYELLYSSIIRWIQNPFSAESNKEWPDLEELLIGASLVGISWAMLRESFVRKFLYNLIMLTPRKEGSHKQWIDHIFHNHKDKFHTILYEFSFLFASNRSLVELDRIYARCAGSLPKSQRDGIKEMVDSVAEAKTFQEVWLRLGMDVPMDDYELTQRIGNFLSHLVANATNWSAREVTPSKIRVPEHEHLDEKQMAKSATSDTSATSATSDTSASSASSATSVPASVPKRTDLAKLKKEREQALAAERANHEGYPNLNVNKSLDPYVCNYPNCGKVYKCRDALFRHLNAMIPKERMIRNYHQDHFRLKVEDKTSLTCGACKTTYPTIGKIHAHYRDKGVPGTWYQADPAPDGPTYATSDPSPAANTPVSSVSPATPPDTSSASPAIPPDTSSTSPAIPPSASPAIPPDTSSTSPAIPPDTSSATSAIPSDAPSATVTTTTTTSAPVAVAPPEKSVDPYERIGVCVVCMEKSREVVNVPCGHMICCLECATKTKTCPMCRAEVKDHVVVYYS